MPPGAARSVVGSGLAGGSVLAVGDAAGVLVDAPEVGSAVGFGSSLQPLMITANTSKTPAIPANLITSEGTPE